MNKKAKKQPTVSTIEISSSIGLTMFIIFVTGGLIAAVLIISSILNQQAPITSSTNNSAITENTNVLDQSTIELVNKLNASDSNTITQTTQDGRTNPFYE